MESENTVTLSKSRAGYIIVINRTRTGYGAHVPDLPGCVAAARSLDHAQRLMDEAIVFHQRGMRADGDRVPRPRSGRELRRRRLLPLC